MEPGRPRSPARRIYSYLLPTDTQLWLGRQWGNVHLCQGARNGVSHTLCLLGPQEILSAQGREGSQKQMDF